LARISAVPKDLVPEGSFEEARNAVEAKATH
jgi:hypothetical protein